MVPVVVTIVTAVDGLGSGAAATRALLPVAISPAPIREPRTPAAAEPVERLDEAAELLDDFLVALLELPGDTWPDLTAALPDELFDRIDHYLESRLS